VPSFAAELTGAAPTPFEKASVLEAWLAANTEVVAGAPPLAPGADPIDQFLLDRRGSLEQAATAMAVMLRSLGVPTRLAVGYLPGQRARLGGEFVVRARHAHAWVEVWLPQAGWVAFDPAGRVAPRSPSRDSVLSRLRHLLGGLWWLLVLVAAVTVVWGASRTFAWWHRRRARPWVTRCYERLTRAGRKRGRPRRPTETPAEYCEALAGEVPDDRLVRVGALLTEAAYSTREPPPDARSWADEVVREVTRTSRSRLGRASRPSGKAPPG
jgi:hypothetical protein